MRWKFLDLIVLILGLGTISEAFDISNYEPKSGSIAKKEGEVLELSCTANDYWKFCSFTNLNTTSNFVTYEYHGKKSPYVQRKIKLNPRIHYTGENEYKTYRCSIRLEKLEENDTGLWECKLEEWNSNGQQENTQDTVTRKWNISVIPTPDFEIINDSVDIVEGKEDETVGLNVTVNYGLKSCIVKKGGEEKCQFTWSESSDEIKKLNNCDENGIGIGNKNDKKTCAIKLEKLKADDEGDWTFELAAFSKKKNLTKVVKIEVLPKFQIDRFEVSPTIHDVVTFKCDSNYPFEKCLIQKENGSESCNFDDSGKNPDCFNGLNSRMTPDDSFMKKNCHVKLQFIEADAGKWNCTLTDHQGKSDTSTLWVKEGSNDPITFKPQPRLPNSTPKPGEEGEKKDKVTIIVVVVVIVAILFIGILVFYKLRNKKQSINEEVSLKNVDEEKTSSEPNANEGYEKEAV